MEVSGPAAVLAGKRDFRREQLDAHPPDDGGRDRCATLPPLSDSVVRMFSVAYVLLPISDTPAAEARPSRHQPFGVAPTLDDFADAER